MLEGYIYAKLENRDLMREVRPTQLRSEEGTTIRVDFDFGAAG